MRQAKAKRRVTISKASECASCAPPVELLLSRTNTHAESKFPPASELACSTCVAFSKFVVNGLLGRYLGRVEYAIAALTLGAGDALDSPGGAFELFSALDSSPGHAAESEQLAKFEMAHLAQDMATLWQLAQGISVGPTAPPTPAWIIELYEVARHCLWLFGGGHQLRYLLGQILARAWQALQERVIMLMAQHSGWDEVHAQSVVRSFGDPASRWLAHVLSRWNDLAELTGFQLGGSGYAPASLVDSRGFYVLLGQEEAVLEALQQSWSFESPEDLADVYPLIGGYLSVFGVGP
jgi:hypothetical protein